MNLRDVYLRLRALVRPRRVERELDEELNFHLDMEARKHARAGLSKERARAVAQARFGSTSAAAEECRDARGTSVIDTTIQDIAYALRTLRRTPTAAITIVGTVALGLGLVAAAFTIFNVFVFRVDAVRDPDTLFAVQRSASSSPNIRRFTLPEFEAMRRDTDVFSDAAARLLDITTRIDGRMTEGHAVTGNFFHLLGVNAALGRTLLPVDDARPASQQVMVLSHSGWLRLYAGDPNVVGRTVLVNGFRYTIVGVMPEAFRGLEAFAPDIWAPLSLVSQFRRQAPGWENRIQISIVGRLKPGLSPHRARAALAVWASHGGSVSADATPTVDRRQLDSIELEPLRTVVPLSPGALLTFSPLFVASGLILLIGCANVANLLLARAVSRQREIGIRLSLGASRQRVIRQLLTESLLLAIASAVCALILSRIILDGTTTVLIRTMPPELSDFVQLSAPGADWRVVAFLVMAAVVSTLLFGLVPAVHATRLDLVRIMRGEIIRNARPNRARNALIVVQVSASALLLICASIFLRSALRASDADPGMRMTDTLFVEIINEPVRGAMLEAVRAEPLVASVAASWPDTPPLGRTKAAFGAPVDAADASPRSRVTYRFVTPEYFSVLDIAVTRGRAFTQAEATSNAAVAIVSEATARQIWPQGDPIGQVLRLEPDHDQQARGRDEPALSSQTFNVVGVARDVAGLRIGEPEAGVYVPTSPMTVKMSLIVRVHGDPDTARRTLLERLTTIDPNMGMVFTMRTLARLETYPLQAGFWLTMTLGGLALILTLSGIFSVLSYLVEQRSKEIGVRLALGATAGIVTRLVLWQSLRLIGIGLVAGGAFAWGLATIVMSTPAGARIGTLVDVFDPLAYSASVACIIVACVLATAMPALRAARIDPYRTLHQD